MASRTTQQKDRSSPVPAPVAGVASLVIPGLGQLLIGQITRGLLLLASMVSIIGLLIWRLGIIARREVGLANRFLKSLEIQPAFVVLAVVGIVILWLWSAWDAYRQAQPDWRRGGFGVFALVLVLFFVLGWQISEVDLVKAVKELPDAWPPISRVLWPWEAAIDRVTEESTAGVTILSPCDDEPPPSLPEEVPGQPYIMVEPTCGDLTTQDENYETVEGTTLTLTGWGFEPGVIARVYWIDPIGNEFQIRQEGEYLSITPDEEGKFQIDIIMPYRLIPPSAEGRQFHELEVRQEAGIGAIRPSDTLKLAFNKMIETIFLGMMATFFGIIFAIPISFLAAKNLMSGSWVSLAIYYLTRMILNIVRAIEPLIWAVVAVIWVGLGPFAGIIALTVHSIAALGKLYSEAIESIDPGPIEAVQATGATRLQTIMYAVVPQMIPPFVSFSIYRWDINVRMSTIIGMVGGGGIGFLLIQYIRLLDYRSAGIPVWFIAITVAILDYVSADIRERFV
jgi:phosphonate transport system permease protein